MVVKRQPKLLQIIEASDTTGSLSNSLDPGQEQPDQNRNDGDDHQELNQSESPSQYHRLLPWRGRTSNAHYERWGWLLLTNLFFGELKSSETPVKMTAHRETRNST
jgi:hypothetical protein